MRSGTGESFVPKLVNAIFEWELDEVPRSVESKVHRGGLILKMLGDF